MGTAHQDQRIWNRAHKIASEEQNAFFKSLKAMPPEFTERIAGVVIRHEPRPSPAMIARGVARTVSSTATLTAWNW